MKHIKHRFIFGLRKHFKNSGGFTLVEMVVTVVIIGILSAVGFVMYTGEIYLSRDATRIANTKALYQGSKNLVAQNSKIPFPDQGVALQASGVHIGYQGYVSTRQSTEMGFDDKNFQDPQTKTPYTYRLNKNRDKSQFLTYLESDKYQKATVFGENKLVDSAYAAEGNIYPYVVGDPLGVILTAEGQAPIQEDTSLYANQSGSELGIAGFSGATIDIIKGETNMVIAAGQTNITPGVISRSDITNLQNETYYTGGSIKNISNTLKNIDSNNGLTCGLIDEKVECWGRGTGQFGNIITIPTNQPEMISVSVGGFGNDASGICGLTATGNINCWNTWYNQQNIYGQMGVPASTPIASFDLGETFGCAIVAGTQQVKCWGQQMQGNPTDQEPVNLFAKQVSSGFDSSCAVTLSGGITCWGYNGYGQINPPIVPGKIATSVSVGVQNACATYDDGSVSCWGRNTNTTFITPPSISDALKVEIGNNTACIYRKSEDITCWGVGISGTHELDWSVISGNIAINGGWDIQAKIGSLYYGLTIANTSGHTSQIWTKPSGDFENIKSLEIGNYISCGIYQDDRFACWGDGQGLRHLSGSLVNAKAIQVETGGSPGACVLKSDFNIECFGTNIYGEHTPPSVAGGFKQISMGDNYACGVTKLTGEIKCWGQGANTSTRPPASITGAKKVVAGGSVGCAIKSDDTVGCWGWNNAWLATLPAGLAGVTDLAGSQQDYCALTRSGSVSCWGWNPYGQRDVPSNLKASAKIANYYRHSCALHTDGDVTCWGQLGGRPQGTTSLPALSGVSTLILGSQTTCGVRGNDFQNLECTGAYAR